MNKLFATLHLNIFILVFFKFCFIKILIEVIKTDVHEYKEGNLFKTKIIPINCLFSFLIM